MNPSNHPSSAPHPDDELLAQIVREWDHANPGAPGPDLDACVRRYPHLETQIRALHEMRQAVDGSRPETASSMPDRLGEFRIVRRMEVGPMGEIYEAVQERLGRRVVVKVLPRGRHSPDARARFMREQTVLARLHQTHIVPIHTAGCEGRIEYFVMPYIEGSALRHVVRTAAEFGSTQPNTQTPSLAVLIEQATSGGADAPTGSFFASESDEPADASTPELATSSFKPSIEYLRSVARVMADAATALQHAHELGIYHRDIKPSNIMVEVQRQLDKGEPSEKCWVIDFGLASYRNGHTATVPQVSPSSQASREASAPGLRPDPGADAHRLASDASPAEMLGARRLDPCHPGTDALPDSIPATSGIMGTPQYMAPEQFDGKADARTDVWGLGVTLYELLTLRRAFPRKDGLNDKEQFADFREQIKNVNPPHPRGRMPLDLAAICFKAIQKEPGERYQTVRDLGDDLRCWLRDEPVCARKSSILRRVALWAKRNKGYAAAIVIGIAAAVTTTGVQINAANTKVISAEANRKAAEARTSEEEARRAAAEARAKASERDSIMQDLQRVRLTDQTAGRSDKVWVLARKAAQIRKDIDVRNQAAATLAGLDAHISKEFNSGASSIAFDSEDKRLLMGGTDIRDGHPPNEARIWDDRRDEPQVSKKPGAGPVAFRLDHTPMQLVRASETSLLLWDVAKHEAVCELTLPTRDNSEPAAKIVIEEMAMAPGASWIAASANHLDEHGQVIGGSVAVWETENSRLRYRFDQVASALVFSPDGEFLAAGDKSGAITVRSMITGKVVRSLASRGPINCIAFGRDPAARENRGRDEMFPTWMLAAGDSSGTITIWNSGGQIQSFCRGSNYEVFGLAFSPDGTLLASGGRAEPRLWDVATGQLVLRLQFQDVTVGLAFSADGSQLATASLGSPWDQKPFVRIWELEYGRGIQTLRGLTGQIEKVVFSRDSRFVAALSHDWRVGVWNADSGRLIRIFEPPRGLTADNAAFAFSPDARQLAFATAGDARLWDVESGQELRSWNLEPGYGDVISFAAAEKLLLFRVELKDGKTAPWLDREHQQPRVCRIRNLLANDEEQAVIEINDFDWGVYRAMVTPDGRIFVADGERGRNGRERFLKVFDSTTGNSLWQIRVNSDQKGAIFNMDPTGEILIFVPQPESNLLIETKTAKTVAALDFAPQLGPEARVYALGAYTDDASEQSYGNSIYRRKDGKQLVSLGIDDTVSALSFDASGRYVLLGRDNGTVIACDLHEIQRRLARHGLGW